MCPPLCIYVVSITVLHAHFAPFLHTRTHIWTHLHKNAHMVIHCISLNLCMHTQEVIPVLKAHLHSDCTPELLAHIQQSIVTLVLQVERDRVRPIHAYIHTYIHTYIHIYILYACILMWLFGHLVQCFWSLHCYVYTEPSIPSNSSLRWLKCSPSSSTLPYTLPFPSTSTESKQHLQG